MVRTVTSNEVDYVPRFILTWATTLSLQNKHARVNFSFALRFSSGCVAYAEVRSTYVGVVRGMVLVVM